MEFRRKLIIFCLAVFAAAVVAPPTAQAVTKEEMDRARAVTAQWYLRWVNNGSDYLDNLNPQSMADLESQLKDKEKENIKAFKNAGTPGDYASWDKDKVVEYWSSTFFQSGALNEKGKGARARVKKKLLALNFTDPADMPKEEPAQTAAPEEPENVAPTQEVPETAPVMPTAEEVIDQTNAAESAAAVDVVPDDSDSKSDSSSSTWLYIVALIVLVGVVVWLVVFASKTMQNSSKAAKDLEAQEAREEKEIRQEQRRREKEEREEERRSEKERRRDEKRRRRAREEEDEEEEDYAASQVEFVSERGESALREKFARTIAIKDEEIRGLQRQIHSLREDNLRLNDDNNRMANELAAARRELSSFKGATRKQVAEDVALETAPVGISRTQISRPNPAEVREDGGQPEDKSAARRSENVRKIYLGRVNSKGIFVRADRKPVEGKSIFVLTSTDSYTGTYKVLQAAVTIDMALDNPEYYLGGGCVAQDITDTAEADGIRTIASGTAVFEDGCWRVLRKAKIIYE